MHDIAPKAAKKTWKGSISCCWVSTWYYGEARCDWDDFFPTLEEVDFNGKLVALFGCGDQEDANTSVTRWTIRDIIEPRGAAIVAALADQGLPLRGAKGGGRRSLHRFGDRRRPPAGADQRARGRLGQTDRRRAGVCRYRRLSPGTGERLNKGPVKCIVCPQGRHRQQGLLR
ncbi:flavodoxin domain-containing protein [Serratia ureilytica]